MSPPRLTGTLRSFSTVSKKEAFSGQLYDLKVTLAIGQRPGRLRSHQTRRATGLQTKSMNRRDETGATAICHSAARFAVDAISGHAANFIVSDKRRVTATTGLATENRFLYGRYLPKRNADFGA